MFRRFNVMVTTILRPVAKSTDSKAARREELRVDRQGRPEAVSRAPIVWLQASGLESGFRFIQKSVWMGTLFEVS